MASKYLGRFVCIGTTCRYTIFGIIFGFLFPVIASLIDLSVAGRDWSLHNLVQIHRANPLLWIIDTAPLFLGLFAWFIGLRTSARLAVEESLRHSEEKFRTVVQSSLDAMIAVNNHGRIFLFNLAAEKLFGVNSEDVIGKPAEFIIPSSIRILSSKRMWTFFETGQNSGIIGKTISRNLKLNEAGKALPVEITLSKGCFGNDRFVLAVIRDVRDKKEAQEREHHLQSSLAQAEKMKSLGLLAGGVAHDLNNMLGPLVGYPELILLKLPAASKIRKQVERIGIAAKEAANVVQDLLALARRGRYEMTPVNLNHVIKPYLESPAFQSLKENNPGIKVEVELDPGLNTIEGSTSHLSKLIMNLMINAFDAISENGRVTIKTINSFEDNAGDNSNHKDERNFVCLSVADNGVGISSEDIDKIFEPYYSKKKMGRSGSGLGLSVVYGVLQDHNGRHEIISKVGEGTEFRLYFRAKAQEAGHDSSTKFAIVGGTESVLVIDDDDAQREVTVDTLRCLGYETLTVSCGEDAVKYLSDSAVDLVVMDMILGKGMDGLDTYREILRMHPEQKAIIVSGYSSSERVKTMQELGAGKYVMKPFTVETIGKAIRKELDKKRTGHEAAAISG